MTNLLTHPGTPAGVTAALNRIDAVADPDDVKRVRDELARLRRVLDAGDDDDVDYIVWTGRADTNAWYGEGGTP